MKSRVSLIVIFKRTLLDTYKLATERWPHSPKLRRSVQHLLIIPIRRVSWGTNKNLTTEIVIVNPLAYRIVNHSHLSCSSFSPVIWQLSSYPGLHARLFLVILGNHVYNPFVNQDDTVMAASWKYMSRSYLFPIYMFSSVLDVSKLAEAFSPWWHDHPCVNQSWSCKHLP